MVLRETWDGSAWADRTHWLPEIWDGSQWVSLAATESDQEEWDGSAWVKIWFSPPLDVSGLSGSAMDVTASLAWTNESGHSPDILIERRPSLAASG